MCTNIFKCFLSPARSIKFCNTFLNVMNTNDYKVILSQKNFKYKSFFFNQFSQYHTNHVVKSIQKIDPDMSPLQMKTRLIRKKRPNNTNIQQAMPGYWNVQAFATAEEYNLEELLSGLLKQNLYAPVELESSSFLNAIHVKAKYDIDGEPREIFFFRQGTVVMWNILELEGSNILKFLKQYEENSYNPEVVVSEQEKTFYTYTEATQRSHLKKGNIHLSRNGNLDRYTFSNALCQTVKLGIWEASLERYIDSIEFITDDLKSGNKIMMTREAVLKKQGEIFALRHLINLSSDLLDTPDFYWERDDLEVLYRRTCDYFSITKRTKVMNEKINHCVELVELLASHLSDRHHIRLEWMIIVLIMVEVAFEIIHYLDRYVSKYEEQSIRLPV